MIGDLLTAIFLIGMIVLIVDKFILAPMRDARAMRVLNLNGMDLEKMDPQEIAVHKREKFNDQVRLLRHRLLNFLTNLRLGPEPVPNIERAKALLREGKGDLYLERGRVVIKYNAFVGPALSDEFEEAVELPSVPKEIARDIYDLMSIASYL